jgi:hypothetical protein
MTEHSVEPSAQGKPGTSAEILRAAANFVESAGLRSGLSVVVSDHQVRTTISQPYRDVAARRAIVIRLAGLIGGTVRQDDNRDYACADLRADGTFRGLRAVVATHLLVQRADASAGDGPPLARSPDGLITAVPGKLPEKWRWVTELDPPPKRTMPSKPHRSVATTPPESEAPRLAARDCPPLTGAALQAATRETTVPQPARPEAAARRMPFKPPR